MRVELYPDSVGQVLVLPFEILEHCLLVLRRIEAKIAEAPVRMRGAHLDRLPLGREPVLEPAVEAEGVRADQIGAALLQHRAQQDMRIHVDHVDIVRALAVFGAHHRVQAERHQVKLLAILGRDVRAIEIERMNYGIDDEKIVGYRLER